MKEKNNKKGFTFIEILVVVTIIGILAAIGLVSYQAVNKKSRDGKKKADLEQIRAALEMYRSDSVSGNYPALLTDLETTYIYSLPSPPPHSQTTGGTDMTDYQQGYSGNGCVLPCSNYQICLKLEIDDSNYCVYSP